MHNKSIKITYILTGTYVVLYVTLLSLRIRIPELSSGQQILFDIQWYIPALLLLPLFIPKVMGVLNKLTNVRTWTIGGLVVLTICIVLYTISKGGLWWSWPTVGLLLVVVILIMNLVKNRMSSGEGFLLGCGCVLIVAAVWEIMYQTGLLYFHNYFGDGVYNYFVTATRLSIWILAGTIIVAVLLNKYKGLVHINGAFTTSIALFAIFTAVWFTNGMYVPLWWHEGAGPFYSELNLLMTSMSRGSKAFFCLAPTMLFIPEGKKEEDIE